MARAFIIYQGPHTLDLSHLEGALVDLQAGSRQGMRTRLEGFEDARVEILGSSPIERNEASIHPDVFEHFRTCDDRIAWLEEKVATAQKQVEVLTESLAHYIDAQQNDLSLMVDAMRSTAKRRRDRSPLARFERSLAYSSQIGDKGAQTKRRKAAEAAADPRAAAAKARAASKGGRKVAPGRTGGKPTPAAPQPAAPAGGETPEE